MTDRPPDPPPGWGMVAYAMARREVFVFLVVANELGLTGADVLKIAAGSPLVTRIILEMVDETRGSLDVGGGLAGPVEAS